MVALPSLSWHTCLPWLLAMGLLYYAARTSRVLEQVKTRPVHSDLEQMTRYCQEIAGRELATAEKDLGTNHQWQGQMLREGAHAHVAQAMLDFGEDRELQLVCMEALRKMASGNSMAATFMARKSALKVILSTGLGFYFDPEVTGKSASTLGFFAALDLWSRSKLVVLGGPQFCSDTLERHPENASAIISACQLAESMSVTNPPVIRRMVMEFEIVKKVQELMQKFPRAEDGVQFAFLEVVDRLSNRPKLGDVAAALIQDGVLEGLAFVLRESGADTRHRHRSIRLLNDLMASNSTVKGMMLEAGIAPLLASSLDVRHDVHNAELQAIADHEAMRILILLQEQDAKKLMAQAGVAETIEKARRTRPKNEGLKELGQQIIDAVRGVAQEKGDVAEKKS